MGCTSARMHLANQRFDVPETSGRLWGGQAGGQIQGVTSIEVVSSTTTASPIDSGTTIDTYIEGDIFTLHSNRAQLGLGKRVDLLAVLPTNSSMPRMLGVRFQFVGEAGEKGFHMAVTGRAGQHSKTEDETTATWRLSSRTYNLGLSAGYRFWGVGGFYLSYNHDQIESELTIDQTNTSANFNIKDSGRLNLLGLGFYAKKRKWFLTAELTLAMATWPRAQDNSNVTYGVAGGWAW